MEIANKIVVVTGGASDIGKAMRKTSGHDRWLHGMRRLQDRYVQP